MTLGIFLICIIMLMFAVTHMLEFDRETSSMELAGELGLIIISGMLCYLTLYLIRGFL
jgi:hypothetical protein